MKSSIKPLAWVVAAAGALLLAGTAMAWRRPTPAAAAPPPAEVSILTVAPETVSARYEYVGQTAASRSVEVRSQVTGVIVARPYAEGTDVAKGTLLFRIDPRSFWATARSASRGFRRARVRSALASRAWALR